MKETGKITKVTITSTPEDNFSFLGIVSSEHDYKLSHLLNKKIGITLSSAEDEIIHIPGNAAITFSKFVSADNNFILLANKSGREMLLRKLSKIDYLLLLSPGQQNNAATIATAIRKIEGVTAVFLLESCAIREKNIEIIHHLIQ